MYGYEMIKELELRSEQVFSLKEGTLYPILHALEAEDLIESYWEETESQRKRKYYSMPFISFGGTQFILDMMIIGIMMNVYRNRNIKEAKAPKLST